MNSLYRVRRAMTKPIKCIALGNSRQKQKEAAPNRRPFRK